MADHDVSADATDQFGPGWLDDHLDEVEAAHGESGGPFYNWDGSLRLPPDERGSDGGA